MEEDEEMEDSEGGEAADDHQGAEATVDGTRSAQQHADAARLAAANVACNARWHLEREEASAVSFVRQPLIVVPAELYVARTLLLRS